MTEILVVGSVNLDISASVSRLPAPGETVTGAELHRFPGGKGANQALAASRLGAKVKLVACVGNDANAKEALSLLHEGGVDLSHCVIDGEAATGVALIAVAENGENHIVVAPGANARLSRDAFDLPPAEALICQLEVPRDTISSVVCEFSGFVCVNLAPSREVEETLLARADLIVVNETEAAWYGDKLLNCKGFIATTHGPEGAELRKNCDLIASATPPTVDTIDTTGAGDTFTAALTLALVEGQSPDRALEFACAAGAVATTRRGAQPSLPTRAEVDSYFDTGEGRGQ
jgi:ribokinase